MQCLVKDLLKNPGKVTEISVMLDYTSIENNGDTITYSSPVNFSGEITGKSNNSILVRGEIDFDYVTVCHSCGEEFKSSLNILVSELFSKDASDGEYPILKNDTLDLEDMIEKNICLSLPVKFLCSSTCKGICHSCGTNLNKETCDCEKFSTVSI